MPLAKKYGAALVALTIDEKGQADTAEWKFEVAKRIYDICVNEYGMPPSDLCSIRWSSRLHRSGADAQKCHRDLRGDQADQAELPGR